MNILVFNCGSSSLTYKIFEASNPDNITTILSGKAHRVGVKGAEQSFIENQYENKTDKEITPVRSHKKAADLALKYIRDKNIQIDYVGHRFVHGGTEFTRTTLIDGEVLEKLIECVPLAPIHNPVSLNVIQQVGEILRGTPQYVAFDSAFHSGIPYYAYTYALPKRIVEEFGFREIWFPRSFLFLCY